MDTDQPKPNALLERAHANYRELFRTIARLRPDGAVLEDDGLLLARSGPALPFLNSAHVLRVTETAESLLSRARAFYAPSGLGFGLTTADMVTEALTPALRAAGLTPHHQSPGMALTPLVGEPPLVSGLEIEQVADLPALRLYNDTMTAGFGGVWALPAALADDSLLCAPELTHYLGRVDGVPVATAMRLTSHRIAGVFNVSTVPAYRGRGIGAAITWRAALDGVAEGCIASALQASDMGQSVYQRMGYHTITIYTLWLPTESGAGGS